MATKQKKHPVGAAVSAARKSKGKQHPLHAESLEHMARELDLNRSGVYLTAVELSKIFSGELKRVRSILR